MTTTKTTIKKAAPRKRAPKKKRLSATAVLTRVTQYAKVRSVREGAASDEAALNAELKAILLAQGEKDSDGNFWITLPGDKQVQIGSRVCTRVKAERRAPVTYDWEAIQKLLSAKKHAALRDRIIYPDPEPRMIFDEAALLKAVYKKEISEKQLEDVTITADPTYALVWAK